MVAVSIVKWKDCPPVVRGCNTQIFYYSLLYPGGCEGLPPKLPDCRIHDPGALDSSADGLWHRLGTLAPAHTQLHTQVGSNFLLLDNTHRCRPDSILPWSVKSAFCVSVASWNNILVLPECSLQTPASVILLQAVTLHLQNNSNIHSVFSLCFFLETGVDVDMCNMCW